MAKQYDIKKLVRMTILPNSVVKQIIREWNDKKMRSIENEISLSGVSLAAYLDWVRNR